MMVEEDDLFRNVTTAALELIGDNPSHIPNVSEIYVTCNFAVQFWPVTIIYLTNNLRAIYVTLDRFRKS